MDGKPVRVVVEIEASADTISGRMSVGGAPASQFYGWLELIDRLERAAAGRPSPGGGGRGE